MVNINGWQANFVKRCEAVGWSVERTNSNHFKVKNAKGKFLFVFPTTPGDVRSMQNTLSDAKRHGLLELEHNAKLLAERDRLERIQRDREASEAVEAEAALERIETALSSKRSDSETADLGTVDGVAIAAIAPALFKSPVMAAPAPFGGAEELLLVDDRIVFRCVKPARTPYRDVEGLCHKTYDNMNSLMAHIRYHGRAPWKKEVDSSAPATATATEQETKSVTKTATKTATKTTNPTVQMQDGRRSDVAALDHAISQAQTSIQKVADGLTALVVEFGTIRDAVRKLPVADEEIMDKARRFDALRGMLKE